MPTLDELCDNRNEYLITRAAVCSEYSNILYLQLIIGSLQKFGLIDKNSFRE